MGGTPADVAAMELRISAINDECIGYSDWDRKRDIHTLAKANNYQTDKPLDKGAWWGHTAPSATSSGCAPMCNLPTVVIRIKANIPAGGGHNADREVPENAFVMKKEMGPWNIKHMMSDRAVEGAYKHLEVAAPTSAYQVTDYARYIPLPASNTDDYINQYVANNVTGYPGLSRDHVTVATSVFICGLNLLNVQHITEHYIHVHGLPQGVSSLRPLETITVDKDTAYKCPDLKPIEEVGTEERAMMVEAVYNMSVTKGVFQANINNKKAASLRKTRAQEFVKELQKACTEQFYGRFFMLLGRTLRTTGQNIQGDFSIKWNMIEECLYNAISDSEGVRRLDNFCNLNYTRFSGRTLELLIYDIDREVDAFQGRWDKATHPGKYMHSLLTKYELIWDIVRNMGDKYSQLKECVKKEIAKIYFGPENEVKDISELQQFLLDKLEAKSITDGYNKDLIHFGGSNKIPTQVAKMKEGKWSKEEFEKYKLAWQEKCPKRDEMTANTIKVVTFIKKLDEEKKDLLNTAVSSNKDYIGFLKTNKIRCCNTCFSQSCLAKYQAAKTLGFGFKRDKGCKNDEKGWRGWNFGHLNDLKFPEGATVINTGSVSIRPGTVPVVQGGLYDMLSAVINESNPTQALPSMMARLSAKPRPRFTAKTILKCGEVTRMTGTTQCVICDVSGLGSFELMDHLDAIHGLDITRSVTVEDWNSALKRHEDSEAREPSEWSDDEYGGGYESEPESLPDSFSSESPPVTPAKNKSVSSAVQEAFQENMAPWKRDMETLWDQHKQLDKEARDIALTEVKNKLEDINATHAGTLAQFANINSRVETMLYNVSANQSMNDTKIGRVEAALTGLSQSLSIVQSKTSAQLNNEHAETERMENTKKLSDVESNQTHMMRALDNLLKDNYIMWQEIMKVKEHTEPKHLKSIMKLSPSDKNQTQVTKLMSSVVNHNSEAREQLNKIEENVTSKMEGATNSLTELKIEMREQLDRLEKKIDPKLGGATNLDSPECSESINQGMVTPDYPDIKVTPNFPSTEAHKKGNVNSGGKKGSAGLHSSSKPPADSKSSAETNKAGPAYHATSGQDSDTTA